MGFDIGSTTVKAVVTDATGNSLLWSDYQRHETKQPERVYEFLTRIEEALPELPGNARVFVTGSGGSAIAERIGGKFVQEVNAVSLAVETRHPNVGSVIELGGQDAKIIVWHVDENSGSKRKLPSMNDKCAGGTGAVIDKICAKLRITTDELRAVPFRGTKLHPVAAKCGVFAETDINGLQKQAVPGNELMASLFAAIVQQNLTVLTRGNTLLPEVLLLGGPNTFIPAMVEAWKVEIPKMWAERNVDLGGVDDPESLILVPAGAEYYAAQGALLYGLEEPEDVGIYLGKQGLEDFLHGGRALNLESAAGGLVGSVEELGAFAERYRVPTHRFPTLVPGQRIDAWIGLDGGSTSTKAVLIDEEGELIAAAYGLSQGNPIADAKGIIADLHAKIEAQGAQLNVRGFGTTGYAKDILKDILGADVALVETVAHTQAARKYYDGVDVIVDVGGQDIKVIFLNEDGTVKDFKLNTQCSAGNGYFLQSTAGKFGIAVEDFADTAFEARTAPTFSYGCAVFMESDIVNFQRLGWQAPEIMAGLAQVLPKNIWLYVVQEPNLKKYGSRFVLQGGTQRNLAAVKAQVDYIEERVPEAEVNVHRFCGESGAIGAALEALRITQEKETGFIGFDETASMSFQATRTEQTRCNFCPNHCMRTFIDTETQTGRQARFIVATCEKGEVTDLAEVKAIARRIAERARSYPNLVDFASKRVFETFAPDVVAREDALPRSMKLLETAFGPGVRALGDKAGPALRIVGQLASAMSQSGGGAPVSALSRDEVMQRRRRMTVGMPRVLNLYSTAPFFRSYLEALGVGKVVWSDYTSEALHKEGGNRGSVDQCFPSKVSVAHIHNLLFGSKNEPDVIFFPSILNLEDPLAHTLDSCACPTVQAAPNVCKAAFTKEGDLFGEHGVTYIDDAMSMKDPALLEKQLFRAFAEVLDLGSEENGLAVREAWKALHAYDAELKEKARGVLQDLVEKGRVGILCIGRPYHHDPGLNHGILEELQQLGYPIFTQESLPDAPQELERLFGDDIRQRLIRHPKEINDVFGNPYSTNSSTKIWAAKYAARHPNLAVLDLSSFKCGHDAPIYHVIERIMGASGTPYFTLHDIDENKPRGSIKIRVETMAYALERYVERLRASRYDNRPVEHGRAGTTVQAVQQILEYSERDETARPVGTNLVQIGNRKGPYVQT
jgi:predicted CoA-substrate-specific enzyme activase